MIYKTPGEQFAPSLKLDGDQPIYTVDRTDEDKAIAFIKYNQSVEGFEMTPEDEEDCRLIFRGEITADESIKNALKKQDI